MNFLEKVSNEASKGIHELEVIITLSILGVFVGTILIVLIVKFKILFF